MSVADGELALAACVLSPEYVAVTTYFAGPFMNASLVATPPTSVIGFNVPRFGPDNVTVPVGVPDVVVTVTVYGTLPDDAVLGIDNVVTVGVPDFGCIVTLSEPPKEEVSDGR